MIPFQPDDHMKTILTTFVSLACAASAWAESTDSRKMPTFDVPAFLEQQGTLLYRTVAVRFNFRSEKLRHLQPNWYEASLWQRDPKAKRGFSFVRVMVAKKDLEAFRSIPSNFQSAAELTAYGRVEREPEAHYIYLRLRGGKW